MARQHLTGSLSNHFGIPKKIPVLFIPFILLCLISKSMTLLQSVQNLPLLHPQLLRAYRLAFRKGNQDCDISILEFSDIFHRATNELRLNLQEILLCKITASHDLLDHKSKRYYSLCMPIAFHFVTI